MTYEPETCSHCGQTTTYPISVDRGTVDIVKQIARFIGRKGINAVHPRKEMEGEYLTSNQVGNLSRARLHGLIARIKGESGNYLLTKKGSEFLRGESIPKVAIIKKAVKGVAIHNIGYFEPDEIRCTISDFDETESYWEGINYKISEGRIIRDEAEQMALFG